MSEPTSGSKDPRQVSAMLQQLHDQGVVDLDAPLRDVIPKLYEQLQQLQERMRVARERGQITAAAPYCFVGDRSWFGHTGD